jgi:hypothetical protein
LSDKITPKHGTERERRIEVEPSAEIALVDPMSGEPVYVGPGSWVALSFSERWCESCDRWIEVLGVLGALRFMAEHDKHGDSTVPRPRRVRLWDDKEVTP